VIHISFDHSSFQLYHSPSAALFWPSYSQSHRSDDYLRERSSSVRQYRGRGYKRGSKSTLTLSLLQQLLGPVIRETILSAFTNKLQEEQQFLAQWRREGPLGILIAIINYIKTPQQYDLFASFQKPAADEMPLELRHKALEPVKPVVTR
jgi:hypothetical protein